MSGERNWSRRFRRGTASLYDIQAAPAAAANPDVELEDLALGSVAQPPVVQPLEEADGEIPNVPIPIEVPPPPNLASLPQRILHSGTVETLIGQNEDLMARLKVNLRRNASLEQRILELEKELSETRHENASLQDQYFIVQEKDRVYKAKAFEFESQYEGQKAEIEFLRTKLDEIAATTRSKIKVLETYMRRVRRWARPSMDRLRGRLEREKLRAIEFAHHIERLREEVAERDVEIGDLKRRLADLSRYEREREGRFQQDQARLVDSYEGKLRERLEQVAKLENDVKYFKERSSRVEDATRSQIEAENKAILYARKNADLERRLNTEVHQLQEQAATYRGEAKSLASELETARVEMRRAHEEREGLEAENARMADQLESLQTLWGESRRQIESLDLRLEALNKINQELAKKLKDQRVQIEAKSLELKPGESAPLRGDVDGDRLRELDSLLANIQSGFPMARSPAAARVRELEILEDAHEAPAEPAAGT